MKQVGRELNVRYVLEGSVQRGGNRLRVNVQLIDAETGNHLWAERFDKPVADLFDMQDEIVSRLANTLNAQLIEAEARRAERSLHPDAMDLYFQGRAWLNKGLTPEHLAQARGFFERALALDPGNVEAMVGMARSMMHWVPAFCTDDRVARFAAAEAALIKALSLAPNHALAHLILGVVLNIYKPRGSRHRRMRAGVGAGSKFGRRARAHRSCQVFSRPRRGNREPYPRSASPLSSRYLRLSVDDVRGLRQVAAWRRRGSGRAVPPSHRDQPKFSTAHFYLAAALAHLGRSMRHGPRPKRGCARSRLSPSRATARDALGDNPTYPSEHGGASVTACARPGCRRGNVRDVSARVGTIGAQNRGTLGSQKQQSPPPQKTVYMPLWWRSRE